MYIIYYLIPVFPLVVRSIFAIKIRKHLKDTLGEEESDRSEIRSYVLALGGFSFTALIALAVLEPNIQQDLQLPIYYVFISFLCYLFALNLQGYKSKRCTDLLSDTLLETASLCLIFTILSLLFVSRLDVIFMYSISILSILIWLLDFIIRIRILNKFYKLK